jgi:DNA-binding response OmpR family regulator
MSRTAGEGAKSMLTVLVVEDQPDIRAVVVQSLEQANFVVVQAASVTDARARLDEERLDVVLLDVNLPDGSGLDLLRELAATGRPPVVMLSSRGEEIDRVLGLELGAEDYVVKPFYPRELATRVRRAAGRTQPPPARIDLGGIVVDPASRQAWVGGRQLELTDREFDLLSHLARSPRRVFSRDDLLREVWQSSPDWQTSKTVTEHIRRLRHKIEDDPQRPRWIITVGSAGYRLDPADGAPG